mmetsp:Transcript_105032/g.182639  ORF Transcript_105032/g.182639 Transcript_105032/m.182639 type:complete len:440 (-) Transcript_105032:52-1371(-)
MMATPLDGCGEFLDNDGHSVEILLDPEVLRALYRRGRRRLRDIQSSSQAALKLDRLRGVLKVSGSKEAVADVQRQLDCVLGSHLEVTPPVWAELMRTRADPDLSQAAVARIQHSSGCRIHIERNSHQVQLFGPTDTNIVAQHLIKELESMCDEEIVDIDFPMSLDLEELQKFAAEFGVTLQVEEMHITVFGIKGAVFEAARELRSYDLDKNHLDQSIDFGKATDDARSAITTAMSRLIVDPSSNFVPPMPIPMHSPMQNASPVQASDNVMQGAVTVKKAGSFKGPSSQQKMFNPQDAAMHSTYEYGMTSGGFGAYCVNCGKPTGKMQQYNFCAYCGHAIEKINQMGGAFAMPQEMYDNSFSYKPGMYCADAIPMMPMQFVQQGVSNNGSQQVLVPVAKCIPFNGQQGLPVLAGNPSNGMQGGSMMLVSPTNGMQGVRCP